MSISTPTPVAKPVAVPRPAVGKKPTAEAHHAAAAQHVHAANEHKAAAQKLDTGKIPEAKKHAENAVRHGEDAAALTNDNWVLYEFWTE